MVIEPRLWGSMKPWFNPFLRAEPGGRRLGGWNQALKPFSTPLPAIAF